MNWLNNLLRRSPRSNVVPPKLCPVLERNFQEMLEAEEQRLQGLSDAMTDATLEHLRVAANRAINELSYKKDKLKAHVYASAEAGGFYFIELQVTDPYVDEIFMNRGIRRQIESMVKGKTALIANYMGVRVVWSVC